jgi:hypothetical protein
MPIKVSMRLTQKQWEQINLNGEVEDLSNELPDGFLMIYQWMRAKIRWKGKIYYASGWSPPDSQVCVDLTEITN